MRVILPLVSYGPAVFSIEFLYTFLLRCDNGEMYFNDKWKADEKGKAWIAADPSSKTKAMCVVCNKTIHILSTREAALESHMIGKKHKSLMEINRSSPPVSHFLSSTASLKIDETLTQKLYS